MPKRDKWRKPNPSSRTLKRRNRSKKSLQPPQNVPEFQERDLDMEGLVHVVDLVDVLGALNEPDVDFPATKPAVVPSAGQYVSSPTFEVMDQVAENYQLKWHSFGTYLHSCIATSLQNEHFADVALVTVDGRQIMAHRFVLSACSQYMHHVLKLQPKVTSSLPLMIILPPEINYRTMKTLIQYMYSGETTVSKDILEPVLRGGDILKIKGLYRPKEDQEGVTASGTSSAEKTVKTYNANNSKNQAKLNSSTSSSTTSSTPPTTAVASKPLEMPPLTTLSNSQSTPPKVLNYTINVMRRDEKSKAGQGGAVVKEEPQKEAQLQKTTAKDKASQNSVIKSTSDEENRPNRHSSSAGKGQSEESDGSQNSEHSDTLQFLVIKEEPIEWSEVSEAEMELVDEKEVFNTEMTIKPEIFMEQDTESPPEELYSPLTCELCTETFTLPAEWVRHVQTHTDMLPAKRQRRGKSCSEEDENEAPFPQLHCDLCQKYFPTPAEWVHHIQNTHTEFELHLSNKTAPGKLVKTGHHRPLGPTQNSCSICAKKFPSHASLLIHKRTHTGEKPFMCELCYKGFNVKSNLLRHLRTVHDKIINPTEVDDMSRDDPNME